MSFSTIYYHILNNLKNVNNLKMSTAAARVKIAFLQQQPLSIWVTNSDNNSIPEQSVSEESVKASRYRPRYVYVST